MTKKEKVAFIRSYFEKTYGHADCTLEYREPYQLVIATILAAQCTDARVNIVTKDLFVKYPTLEAFADADLEELMEDIRSTGFFRNKAKSIKGMCRMLIDEYGGRVPDTMEDLLRLPGVGRKIANLTLGDVYGKPAIVVDTHCKRITKLIGLTDNDDPTKVEADLRKIVPPDYGNEFCHCLVEHGRAVCVARRPRCGECGIAPVCRYAKATVGK